MVGDACRCRFFSTCTTVDGEEAPARSIAFCCLFFSTRTVRGSFLSRGFDAGGVGATPSISLKEGPPVFVRFWLIWGVEGGWEWDRGSE